MLGQGMAGSSGGGASSSHSYTCGQEQWSIHDHMWRMPITITPSVAHLDETITDHQRGTYNRPWVMLYTGALYKVNL